LSYIMTNIALIFLLWFTVAVDAMSSFEVVTMFVVEVAVVDITTAS